MDFHDQEELLFNNAKDSVSEHLVLGTYQDDIRRELKRTFNMRYSLTRKGDSKIKLTLTHTFTEKSKTFFL